MVTEQNEAALAARTRAVVDKARSLGFDVVGVARADVPLDADFAHYERFLDEGLAGDMTWLADARATRARLDTSDILAGAKSVVCVARRYQRSTEAEALDPPVAQTIARYARGRDYHNGLRKKLRQLAVELRRLGGEARPLVDDAPVLERAWAARAGLGFVGKSGMLIVPGVGSYVLLGEVVTTLHLAPSESMGDRCGACTRCLDACPTEAFVAPFRLDARRCISYLTIEHRGEAPPELLPAIGERLFGCDECQSVCPFNASARPRDTAATRMFDPKPVWAEITLNDLLRPEAFQRVAEGSPVHRATAEGLGRNAAIVLGNRRDRAALPDLRAAALAHPSELVRSACRWAIRRIEG